MLGALSAQRRHTQQSLLLPAHHCHQDLARETRQKAADTPAVRRSLVPVSFVSSPYSGREHPQTLVPFSFLKCCAKPQSEALRLKHTSHCSLYCFVFFFFFFADVSHIKPQLPQRNFPVNFCSPFKQFYFKIFSQLESTK